MKEAWRGVLRSSSLCEWFHGLGNVRLVLGHWMGAAAGSKLAVVWNAPRTPRRIEEGGRASVCRLGSVSTEVGVQAYPESS